MRISGRARAAVATIAAAALATVLVAVAGAQGGSGGGFDLIRQVSVGARPGPVTYGYGAGWVVNQGDPSVTRIDAATGATVTTPVGAGPISITAGFSSVWVLTGEGKSTAMVYRLAGATGKVQKTFKVALPINWGADIATAAGYVWASSDGQPKLVRIDPGTNAAAIRKVPVHAGFTTGDSKLWTTVYQGSSPKLQSWNPTSLAVERSTTARGRSGSPTARATST
jgi:streptogramin lyase